MDPTRRRDLRAMLETRRREIEEDVHGKVRATDPDDIGFALLQMHAEVLRRIDNALIRLDTGNYGRCAECGDEIPEKRLHALPFAVRCRDCQETSDTHDRRRRAQAQPGAPTFARIPDADWA